MQLLWLGSTALKLSPLGSDPTKLTRYQLAWAAQMGKPEHGAQERRERAAARATELMTAGEEFLEWMDAHVSAGYDE